MLVEHVLLNLLNGRGISAIARRTDVVLRLYKTAAYNVCHVVLSTPVSCKDEVGAAGAPRPCLRLFAYGHFGHRFERFLQRLEHGVDVVFGDGHWRLDANGAAIDAAFTDDNAVVFARFDEARRFGRERCFVLIGKFHADHQSLASDVANHRGE